MSFWETFADDFSSERGVVSVLKRPQFSLEDVLGEDDVVQELAMSSDVVKYVVSVLPQLVDLVITPAPEGSSEERKFRQPFLACQLLRFDSNVILDSYFENDASLLVRLFSLLSSTGSLPSLCAEYFSQILIKLLDARTDATLTFLTPQRIELLLNHLSSVSILNVVLQIFQVCSKEFEDDPSSTPPAVATTPTTTTTTTAPTSSSSQSFSSDFSFSDSFDSSFFPPPASSSSAAPAPVANCRMIRLLDPSRETWLTSMSLPLGLIRRICTQQKTEDDRLSNAFDAIQRLVSLVKGTSRRPAGDIARYLRSLEVAKCVASTFDSADLPDSILADLVALLSSHAHQQQQQLSSSSSSSFSFGFPDSSSSPFGNDNFGAPPPVAADPFPDVLALYCTCVERYVAVSSSASSPASVQLSGARLLASFVPIADAPCAGRVAKAGLFAPLVTHICLRPRRNLFCLTVLNAVRSALSSPHQSLRQEVLSPSVIGCLCEAFAAWEKETPRSPLLGPVGQFLEALEKMRNSDGLVDSFLNSDAASWKTVYPLVKAARELEAKPLAGVVDPGKPSGSKPLDIFKADIDGLGAPGL